MNPIQIGPHLFTPEALQQAIVAAGALPSDKKGAFVGTVDTSGVSVTLQARITDHIELETSAKWTGGQDFTAGAKIVASW